MKTRKQRYAEYLASPEWGARRSFEVRRARGCCEFCGKSWGVFHVHHLSYDRLGNELPSDLIVLCANCHEDAHQFPQIHRDIRRFAARRQPWPERVEAA